VALPFAPLTRYGRGLITEHFLELKEVHCLSLTFISYVPLRFLTLLFPTVWVFSNTNGSFEYVSVLDMNHTGSVLDGEREYKTIVQNRYSEASYTDELSLWRKLSWNTIVCDPLQVSCLTALQLNMADQINISDTHLPIRVFYFRFQFFLKKCSPGSLTFCFWVFLDRPLIGIHGEQISPSQMFCILTHKATQNTTNTENTHIPVPWPRRRV